MFDIGFGVMVEVVCGCVDVYCEVVGMLVDVVLWLMVSW